MTVRDMLGMYLTPRIENHYTLTHSRGLKENRCRLLMPRDPSNLRRLLPLLSHAQFGLTSFGADIQH
jgi:hypothetical protein